MQFQTRSKGQVITDLASKVLRFPSNHPERPRLIRMIEGLRAELREQDGRGRQHARTAEAVTDQIALVERRRSPRHRALLGAQIIFRDGMCSMGCLIVGISPTGATVRPNDIFVCPSKFVLKPRFAAPRECEVVWQKGDQLGVRYAQDGSDRKRLPGWHAD
jgi:hypothetical protein